MNQKTRMIHAGLEPEAMTSGASELLAMVPAPTAEAGFARSGPEAVQALEKIKASLVFAYMNSSLSAQGVPLKSFMDDVEKKIVLACLRLTRGNQKNAAALMSLKPTSLFEKMRKHGIHSQRGRLPRRFAMAACERQDKKMAPAAGRC